MCRWFAGTERPIERHAAGIGTNRRGFGVLRRPRQRRRGPERDGGWTPGKGRSGFNVACHRLSAYLPELAPAVAELQGSVRPVVAPFNKQIRLSAHHQRVRFIPPHAAVDPHGIRETLDRNRRGHLRQAVTWRVRVSASRVWRAGALRSGRHWCVHPRLRSDPDMTYCKES